MTPEQVVLVRGSWPALGANAAAFTAQFYARLFEIDKGAARLFAGVDMASQQKKLAQALAVMVKALDDPDQLLPAVAALGRRHAGYGVEDHHFNSVGEALIGALGDVGGDDFTPAAQRAWLEVYTLVASVMRRAVAATSAA